MHKSQIGFTMTTQNITSLDGSNYEAIYSSILQNIFSYLKIFSKQFRKIITVEDNKKRTNITNLYKHINLILYVIKMTQNKNDSINSCY